MDKPSKSLPLQYYFIVKYSDGSIKLSHGVYDRSKLEKGASMHEASHRLESSIVNGRVKDEILSLIEVIDHPEVSESPGSRKSLGDEDYTKVFLVARTLTELLEYKTACARNEPVHARIGEALDVGYFLAFALNPAQREDFMNRVEGSELVDFLRSLMTDLAYAVEHHVGRTIHRKWKELKTEKYPGGYAASNTLTINAVQDLRNQLFHLSVKHEDSRALNAKDGNND
jgi:hypothetical protein